MGVSGNPGGFMTTETKQQAGDLLTGLLLCVLICGASLAIDLTSAWSLSDHQTERGILLAVAAGAVLWKGLGAIKLRSLWGQRRYGAMVLPAVLVLVALAVSCSMELRFYKRIFADTAEARGSVAKQRKDLKTEIGQLDERILSRQAGMTSDELWAKIDWELSRVAPGDAKRRPLRETSNSCYDATSPSYTACGDVIKLRGDLASAEAAIKMTARRDTLRAELSALPAIAGGDALGDSIGDLTGVKSDRIMLGISALVMLLIQLGSISLPTAYFGGHPVGTPSASIVAESDIEPESASAGPAHITLNGMPSLDERINDWVHANLRSDPSSTLPAAMIHEVWGIMEQDSSSQRAWCKRLTGILPSLGLPCERVRFGPAGHTGYSGLAFGPEAKGVADAIARRRVVRRADLRVVGGRETSHAQTA